MTDAPAALFLGQSFEGAAENLLFKRANRVLFPWAALR